MGDAPVTKKTKAEATPETIECVKGFDADFRCRGFQYEVGGFYRHEGKVEACASGFHACEHPLDVFNYYEPATSRFAVVTMGGETQRHDVDTKIASAEITIKAEIGLPEVIDRAIRYVFARATPENREHATGYSGAASATGDRGAASATGDRGAASATGDSGAASATGDRGAASATGDHSVAMASGWNGKAMAAEGCAIFLAERDNETDAILHVFAGIAGRDGIEPDTFYTLRDGKPVPA